VPPDGPRSHALRSRSSARRRRASARDRRTSRRTPCRRRSAVLVAARAGRQEHSASLPAGRSARARRRRSRRKPALGFLARPEGRRRARSSPVQGDRTRNRRRLVRDVLRHPSSASPETVVPRLRRRLVRRLVAAPVGCIPAAPLQPRAASSTRRIAVPCVFPYSMTDSFRPPPADRSRSPAPTYSPIHSGRSRPGLAHLPRSNSRTSIRNPERADAAASRAESWLDEMGSRLERRPGFPGHRDVDGRSDAGLGRSRKTDRADPCARQHLPDSQRDRPGPMARHGIQLLVRRGSSTIAPVIESGRRRSRKGGSKMESTYKIIELVGTPRSRGKAAKNAVEKGRQVVRASRRRSWRARPEGREGKVVAYRARVKVSFKYEVRPLPQPRPPARTCAQPAREARASLRRMSRRVRIFFGAGFHCTVGA